MPEPLIVTLDGPAGVGKTTLARRVAQALGVAYLDTGAMFRACALRLGPGAWDLSGAALAAALAPMAFTLEGRGDRSVLKLDGTPVGDEVRSEEVGIWASHLAARAEVRDFMRRSQQAIGASTSLVAEGRDMGTVIFPGAARKFFLDADPTVRALRRVRQLEAMGRMADLAAVEQAIRVRDRQDRNRAIAPLAPASDAVLVDTSNLNADQVFHVILDRLEGCRPA